MCGQLLKDSGTVIIGGEDIEKGIAGITRRLGVVFKFPYLDQPLSVKANLQSRAALYGITGADFKRRLEELAGFLILRGC